MNDPHVVSLRYRLVPIERAGRSAEFDTPPPLEHTTKAFRVRLDSGIATFEMREHHPSEASARSVVDPFARAWEIKHALSAGVSEFALEYEDAEVIDREPPPPPPPGSPKIVQVGAATAVGTAASVGVKITRTKYPDPPSDFALDPDVEALWQRWEGYLEAREPLQGMAYFCLTVLQMYGGRSGAAARFGVSGKVLATLARLATETGDPATARKAEGASRPITPAEEAWVEATMKRLVQRAGQITAGVTDLPEITMSELPRL